MKLKYPSLVLSSLMILAASHQSFAGPGVEGLIFGELGDFVRVHESLILHGSVDGQNHHTIVVGLQDGYKTVEHLLGTSISKDQLVALGEMVYDPEHKRDVVPALREGLASANSWAHKLPVNFWENVASARKSFQVHVEKANADSAHASDSVVADLKYGAEIAVGVMEGSAFLFVKLPTEAVVDAVCAGAAVPARMSWHGLKVVGKAGAIGLKFGGHVGGAAFAGCYSVASTTVNLVATDMVVAGHYVKMGVESVLNFPHWLSHWTVAKVDTDVSVDQLDTFMLHVLAVLKDKKDQHGAAYDPEVTGHEKFSATISMLEGALTATIAPHNGKLGVHVEATTAYVSQWAEEEHVSPKAAVAQMNNKAAAIEAEILAHLRDAATAHALALR